MLLLSAACCIEETSLLDFTMSSVARKSEMSMGTVYKHFYSKEDLIVALCTLSIEHRVQVLEKLFSMFMNTPQKLAACCLLNTDKMKRYPFSGELEVLSASESLLARVSELRRDRLEKANACHDDLVVHLLEAAINNGELILDDGIERRLNHLFFLILGYLKVGNESKKIVECRLNDRGHLAIPERSNSSSCLDTFYHMQINACHWRSPLDEEGVVIVTDILRELNLD
nr:TetR/AcrR family transcriptional regulator [Pseudomaricurvus alkylphenolicus]